MEKVFEGSLMLLKNLQSQSQFEGDILEDKNWTKDDQDKFWQDFEKITMALKNEVNKLALLVDINDKKKPNENEIESMCKSVESICITLWSNFLLLSTRSGQTLCQSVSASCQSILKSTFELMTSLSKCSKRKEALQKVGEIWQKYDEIKGKTPKDNVQAVQVRIQVRNSFKVLCLKYNNAKTLGSSKMTSPEFSNFFTPSFLF